MSQPFVGEIRMWAIGWAPKNWALCNGQLLPIAQNAQLYSLLGNRYGGDNRTTVGLPDFRGRTPVNEGHGYIQGQRGGEENVTLTVDTMPVHTHVVQASTSLASSPQVSATKTSIFADANQSIYGTTAAVKEMSPLAISSSGGGQSHTNLQPSASICFCIALDGLYPPRN